MLLELSFQLLDKVPREPLGSRFQLKYSEDLGRSKMTAHQAHVGDVSFYLAAQFKQLRNLDEGFERLDNVRHLILPIDASLKDPLIKVIWLPLVRRIKSVDRRRLFRAVLIM